ncbi:hypothetical protein GCM10007205_16830 [Oxalicibacterium flavum]|uniref:Photolyase/cryptochrome alpha/beta domain-containing protein n=1 Tax=Oxalicibacterium flavum TaxID=179467 RepID=A0A8J2XXB1_9BURK|nr:hypothetical protein GCM10007205_16830 [Oxalicibacterium flavum]
MPDFDRSLVWLRRDLRSFDHAALHHALAQSRQVYCVFVFDRTILDLLPRRDKRVEFIHASLRELDGELKAMGGGLIVLHDHAEPAIPRLAAELDVEAVFVNRDYEPQAVRRDRAVATALERDGRTFHTFKDQVIFECSEILTKSGTPFSVFTPYKNAWLRQLHAGGDMGPSISMRSVPVWLHHRPACTRCRHSQRLVSRKPIWRNWASSSA